MDHLYRLVNWLPDLLRPWNPPPSLPSMSLTPRDGRDNPLMLQFFTWESKHPTLSWWKHLESQVPRLSQMGFSQIWLPPPNKAMRKAGQGYDAYDLWDLGEFQQKGTIATRWGTKEDLQSAVATARLHGIDILIDAVLNHKIGGDGMETFKAVPVDPANRLKDIGPARDIQGWTKFDFPGRGSEHSSFHWDHTHFTGIDWDNKTRCNGVYRILRPHNHGWSHYVDRELGNYDYLLGVDIDHGHPEVRQDLLSWGSWVLDTTGGAGFRLDAIKHIDRRFILDFLMKVRSEPGRTNMFAVAEYWSANVNLILPYIRAFSGHVAFFDVPLHDNFHQASKGGRQYDLRKIFDRTVVKVRPDDAVTFVDNHDMQQIGQSLESWVYSSFKLQAYALILLRSHGHPCVFYGDLYPNEECYDEEIAQNLQALIEVRKRFAYGPMEDYFATANCIGFVRSGDDLHPGCVVLVSNDDERPKNSFQEVRMNVGITNAGCIFRTYLDPPLRTQVSSDGWGTFSCPANGLQVWVKIDG
ncbi:glycoside hydrolase family 13 protein [Jaapia argillacea MUCL 33604]|uniref:Glycoside hydrolase family 13 protein n=1 Tax=Jaapia argillacea MUCL 33604 TaxID=933084 RepID=A0A067Q6X1_9AGAM|nr:glycoside hydrolase family 13 protein [Jaapia argillacea MUCL 33604]